MTARNSTHPYELPPSPELHDLDRAWARNVQLRVRTLLPATVILFDPATQTAKVRVDTIPVLIDPETGLELPQKPLQVTVPVRIPGDGKSDGYLSFPILPGNTGTLHVFDRDVQGWLRRTMPRAVVPFERALHQVHDAYFEPGLTDNAHRIPTPVDLTAVVLNHSTGIKLGRNAALGVARLTDKTSADATMAVWIAAAHTVLTAAAAFLAIPFAAPVPTDFGVITQASTKVKAE
jgi:hypothetical protein